MIKLRILTLAMAMMSTFPAMLFGQMPHDSTFNVTTAYGPIRGLYEDGVRKWLGVPFAQPPVGNLRWRPPQAPTAWTDLRYTRSFGPSPMQHNVFGDLNYRSPGFSEDCLYLNVWAPAASKIKKPLPVLLYFYGGGFVGGDASETRYDGSSLAREGVIVVTSNYRLNVFGFMAHPELSKESPEGASGNYGLMDQAAALSWVKDNIAAFGGDPNRITIAGESAGSFSVSLHFASPLSKGKFAGAIAQSGAAMGSTLKPVPLEEAEEKWMTFARQINAPTLAQLRAMDANTLYEHFRKGPQPDARLVLDGYFLPHSLADAYAKNDFARVPLMIGWTSKEGGDGQWVLGGEGSETENFRAAVSNRFGDKAPDILKLYPHSTEAELKKSAREFSGDAFIAFGTWKWASTHAQESNAPVYRYYFDQARPGQGEGAYHAADIPYAMATLNKHGDYPYEEDDFATEKAFSRYILSFLEDGNPNVAGQPDWQPLKTEGALQPVMHLRDGARQMQANDARYEAMDAMQ